jgi:ATP-dependent helicase HrpB
MKALHPLIPHPSAIPIDDILPEVLRQSTENPVIILSAAPGAGKTTRIPIALLDHPAARDHRIIMLEPRRLAAQRAAEYMSIQRNEQVGETIGYRIRGASRVSRTTRIEVVTEGILTRMLQDAPDLPGIGIIIFDEFHERTIHADVGLALALDVQATLRPDLRILIMSATLDGVGLKRILPDAPVIDSPGRQFPVETIYASFRPEEPIEKTMVRTVTRAVAETEGDILAFLPGRRELHRTRNALLDAGLPPEIHVHLLHGEADPYAQREALAPPPAGRRKVILATSVAETSVTIDGVHVVIDCGLARVPVFDPRRGMTGLDTVPVSQATADQRRGRAGRQGPGVCYRLWTEVDHAKLDAYPTSEIRSADLAPLAIELARWGDPWAKGLKLIDPPPELHLAQAYELLQTLGAVEQGRLTQHGQAMSALPLHPRLAQMVLKAREFNLASDACKVAAFLESPSTRATRAGVDVDLASAIHAATVEGSGDRATRMQIRAEAERLRQLINATPTQPSEESYGFLLGLAYPDRIGRRRGDNSRRYHLSGGTGVILPEWSLLSRSEFLAVGAVDNAGTEARIFLAAPITIEEIRRMAGDRIVASEEVQWDAREQAVIARRVERLGALPLIEQQASVEGEPVIEAMLVGFREMGVAALPWNEAATSFRQRSEWVRQNRLAGDDWPDLSDDALLRTAGDWLAPYLAGITRRDHLSRLDLTKILAGMLTHAQRAHLDRMAPIALSTPAGGRMHLQYGSELQPVMAVRLQEMFGQTDSPTVAGGKVRVLLHLLSPAGRPLAVTADLGSFWANAYTEVRKQMRGRYPKHRWPEDPLEAVPGSSIKKKKGLA